MKEKKIAYWMGLGGVSFIFLITYVLGWMLDTQGYVDLQKWWMFGLAIVITPVMALGIHVVYHLIEQKALIKKDTSTISIKENIIYAVYLGLAWGIVLLGVYPGFFVYDASYEVLQVITREFSTHHPLLHVLYLGGTVQAGYKIFGTYNAGIFAFTLMQMIFFLIGIIYVVNKMKSFGFHRYLCRGTIIFMGIFPIYPMMVLCSTKDSIFSLILLLWIVNTYEWWKQPGKYCKIRWVLWTVLLCMLRNNAVYALLVTAVCMFIFIKEHRKNIIVLVILAVGISTVLSNALMVIFHAEPGGKQEMITVPIQQLARTYQYEQELFSEEDKEILLSYLPEQNLGWYAPKVSDLVKVGFNNEQYKADAAGFWDLWWRIGKKAPMSYINAWLMTCYGYWYSDAKVDVYTGSVRFSFTYDDNSYFGYETEEPGFRDSKIPFIDEFYRKLSLEVYKEKIPVIAQLFSMGFMFWVYIFTMVFMFKKNGIQSIMPYIVVFWIIATLLLGPTYLPRYVFFLWLVIPFMLGDALCKKECNE